MKKLLSAILALAFILSASSCTGGNTPADVTEATEETTLAEETTTGTPETTPAETTAQPDEMPAEMRSQYDAQTEKLQQLISSVSEEKTVPTIHITTLDGSQILSKDEYVTSVIDVFNCDEEYVLTASGGVKVRGNSTADNSPNWKPYRIKFDSKQGMLGLHGGEKYKSWVLLMSYWNLVPDYMAFSLAREIYDGRYYSSDCAYVNLYVNGRYAGMYLLCEQNQAADGRIDISEPKPDETQLETGYLLEIDNYVSEEHPFFAVTLNGAELTDIDGTTRPVGDVEYSIKSDTNTDEQRAFIEKYINGVFNILYQATSNNKPMMFDENYDVVPADGTYSTAQEAVEEVLDLEAAADMLILQELVHNYDVGEGSFYMAVDFSPDSVYKKLTFVAPWDFNWAYNDGTNGKYYAGAFQPPIMEVDRSNYWLIMLYNADWFRDIVKEKWKALSESKTLVSVARQVRKDAEQLRNDLGETDYVIGSAGDVVNFVLGRIEWLDTQWSK